MECLWGKREAATFLSIGVSTLERLMAKGDMPYARIGGQVRFDPDLLRSWATEQMVTRADPSDLRQARPVRRRRR